MPIVLSLEPSVDQSPVNVVTNPGFETDTSGWTAYGTSTISRVTSEAKYGASSMRMVVNGATSGAYYTATLAGSTGYTFSVWMKSTAGNSLERQAWAGTVGTFASNAFDVAWVASGDWEKKTSTFTTGAAGQYTVYLTSGTAVNGNIYVDGVQWYITPSALSLVSASTGTLTLTPNT